MTVKLCRRCVMPSSRPRIRFDSEGVCNACRYHETKKEIDWGARAAEFLAVVKRHRGAGPYDCVVPFSGGKDSATVAWRLREAGLRPLLVCYGQLLWTDVGRANLDRVVAEGFDCIYWRVDQRVSRHLAGRFFRERGHPKQAYDAGVNSVPLITAKNFGIPLVFYAEHGETEYGGHILSDEHRRTRDLAEVLEHQIGDHPANWATDGITEREIWPYVMPDDLSGVTAYYFSYFFPWSIQENMIFARDHLGFEGIEPRSDASFEGRDSIDDMIDGLDFHAMFVKFGFGRATRMASRLIQLGHLTREQGLEYVRLYDHEFPEMYLGEVLQYLDMDRDELTRTLDLHRNPEIWEKVSFSRPRQKNLEKWRLRHAIV